MTNELTDKLMELEPRRFYRDEYTQKKIDNIIDTVKKIAEEEDIEVRTVPGFDTEAEFETYLYMKNLNDGYTPEEAEEDTKKTIEALKKAEYFTKQDIQK